MPPGLNPWKLIFASMVMSATLLISTIAVLLTSLDGLIVGAAAIMVVGNFSLALWPAYKAYTSPLAQTQRRWNRMQRRQEEYLLRDRRMAFGRAFKDTAS